MEGVYTTSVNENTLDEAPMAYKFLKDIIDVIRESVDVIDVMKPIYNFKAIYKKYALLDTDFSYKSHLARNPWLEEKIKSGKIKMYSDRDIVNELSELYGMAATNMYLTLLQINCETFNAGFLKNIIVL